VTGSQRLLRELRDVIEDDRVLEAIAAVAREQFVPEAELDRAYENVALPIACEQTISQPLVVARMLELLAPLAGDRVLDVGTGSGYHAALLSRLAGEVWTIERHAPLSDRARETLARCGYANVRCVVGDGSRGLPEHGPFDVINVAAAVGLEFPRALVAQLGPGGRLVAPVGRRRQHLVRITRTREGLVRERFDPVRFVPLVRGPVDR
jgi:protein-L-isoaspartate(D-aspartate) O-methyltransferase